MAEIPGAPVVALIHCKEDGQNSTSTNFKLGLLKHRNDYTKGIGDKSTQQKTDVCVLHSPRVLDSQDLSHYAKFGNTSLVILTLQHSHSGTHIHIHKFLTLTRA